MAGEAGGTGIYCRLSHVADRDDTTKVDDQERICRDMAATRGWRISEVWKDNNRSAWQRTRKRPGWQAMLEAISAGRIRRIIIYHGDRLIRQPYDLELLINLADARGIHLHSPTGTRNLDNPDDRFVLRIEAAQACRESDNISRRKKAGFERMRLQRRAPVPGGAGGRAFGYARDGRTPVPEEASAVREAAERILAGQTMAAICRSLSARGIRSTTGREMHYSNLRKILLRPRTAGLLSDSTPGSWEPLISPATQARVRLMLAARTPARPVTTADDVYLLTGVALCYACGHTVRSSWAGTEGRAVRGYGCMTRGCYKVRRNAAHLDAYVTGRVIGYLASVEFTSQPGDRAGSRELARELAQARADRAGMLRAMETLHERPGAGEAAGHLAVSIAGIEEQIGALEARQAAAEPSPAARHRGLTLEQFESMPVHVRRQIIAACYKITILPRSRWGPGFNPEDVRLEERQG